MLACKKYKRLTITHILKYINKTPLWKRSIHVGEQINRPFYSCGLEVDYVLMQTSFFSYGNEQHDSNDKAVRVVSKQGPTSLTSTSKCKKAKHYTYNHAKFMLTSVLIVQIKNTKHSIRRGYNMAAQR